MFGTVLVLSNKRGTMPHIRRTIVQAVVVLMVAAAFILAAPAHPADAATECVTFDLAYEVRPGPARAIIGVPLQVESWDLPDHWLGFPGTVHVETANGPSVHWNNFLTLTTNGFETNVTGTEDTANGVRIGDRTIDALGSDLTADYTIGTRDPRDVPGVEGASLEGTVTICAILPDVTTTTTQATTTTTTGDTTTTTTPEQTTTTGGDTTTTTGPDGSTTTTPDGSTTSTPDESTTVPPVTSPPTLPFTGPEDHLPGIGMAAAALFLLGAGVLLAARGER